MLAKTPLLQSLLAFVLVPLGARYAQAAPGAAIETNPPALRDLNTPRTFPKLTSREQWERRAKELREQVLVSCGLWPMPSKEPIQAHVFGKIARDGYTIEKVYFQTYPGLFLGGNLYRPVGHGQGPFPAVLNPHGHWNNGRMADTKDGSIAARCISFARQGMLAFSYDMVGYNDTHFADTPATRPFYEVHREVATNRSALLWNISLMGLQTWNSIRALDFLESLPDVDRRRLACTGESGGGTQTYMLAAVDDRLAAQAPVVMVSHIMQGGCLCENAPGLRVEYSNMEIAAAAAPRPQMLVAATGDWTKDTPTVEGPALARVYQLLQARDRFDYVQFNFGHNYNQTSREAVYAWFGKWLLERPAPAALKEAPYQKEPDADLRVFTDGQLPAGAMTQEQFVESLKQMHRAEWNALAPRTKGELRRFQETLLPAWRHTLLVDFPSAAPQQTMDGLTVVAEFTTAKLKFRVAAGAEEIEATYWAPARLPRRAKIVVVCAPASNSEPKETGAPGGLTLALLKNGFAVLNLEGCGTTASADQFANYFTTYNRTLAQERVRTLLDACAVARSAGPRGTVFSKVLLLGRGVGGLWALLAAPGADSVIADCAGLDAHNEQRLLEPDLFCPGLLSMGGFEGAAMLAAPHPLLLHNARSAFPAGSIKSAYAAAGAKQKLRIESTTLSDEEIVRWAAALE